MENATDRSQYKLDKPLAELSDAELDELAARFPVDKPVLPLTMDEVGKERLLISDEGQVALGALLDRVRSESSDSAS